MASSLKRVFYNWIFWLKKCTLHFQTSVGSSNFLKMPIRNDVCVSDCIVRMKSRCWCQISLICTSICGCSRLKLLRMLGYVIARKYKEGLFWKVGGARFSVLGLFDFSTGLFSIFFLFIPSVDITHEFVSMTTTPRISSQLIL